MWDCLNRLNDLHGNGASILPDVISVMETADHDFSGTDTTISGRNACKKSSVWGEERQLVCFR